MANQKIIKAVFKGSNGSLGYEQNKQYTLVVTGMTVERFDGSGKCQYESLLAFVSNWDLIQQTNY